MAWKPRTETPGPGPQRTEGTATDQAGGGPAPQAPRPSQPAGQIVEATRTRLGREASGLGTRAPT